MTEICLHLMYYNIIINSLYLRKFLLNMNPEEHVDDSDIRGERKRKRGPYKTYLIDKNSSANFMELEANAQHI